MRLYTCFRSVVNCAKMLHLGIFVLSVACLSPIFASPSTTEAPKVAFTLYYESLCPDCQQFIGQQLYPTYLKISQIINLTLVPYGNAEEFRRGDKWVFECQHGPLECEGNLIETCALSILNNISVSLPFIHCFEESTERSAYPQPFAIAEKCATILKIGYADIKECAKGPKGMKLEHEMALKTNALEPPHKYVPWVTINGKHTEKINQRAQRNLLGLVCDYYTGTKPKECEQQYLGRGYKIEKMNYF